MGLKELLPTFYRVKNSFLIAKVSLTVLFFCSIVFFTGACLSDIDCKALMTLFILSLA